MKKTLQNRANKVLAQSCLTYSKRADQFIAGIYPTHNVLEDSIYIYGENGNKYMDFSGGLGTVSINIDNMSILPHYEEVLLAEELKERIPCLERMKFLKTGSEACLAAIRIARAWNHRKCILGVGYHGWGDIFMAAEKENDGAINFDLYTKFDNLEKLKDYLILIEKNASDHSISAVIIEPVILDMNVINLLINIKYLCTKLHILLIFDEIITGFRVPKYCIANFFDIQPDILILGKQIAFGHPLSIIGGKCDIMNNPKYFVSSTFAGELYTIKQARKFLRMCTNDYINDLWENGKFFQEEFNSISPDIYLKGYPTRSIWAGDDNIIWLFWQEMCKKGYILGKSFFYNSYIDGHSKQFLKDAYFVIEKIDNNECNLEGNKPQPIFQR